MVVESRAGEIKGWWGVKGVRVVGSRGGGSGIKGWGAWGSRNGVVGSRNEVVESRAREVKRVVGVGVVGVKE